MKKLHILLCASLFVSDSQAQITISSTDMPAVGWKNYQNKDMNRTSVNWGSKGANQVYNFGTYTSSAHDTTYYLAPNSTQSAAQPAATIAVTNDHSTYLLGKNSTAKFEFDGIDAVIQGAAITVPFTTVDNQYMFPTQYGGHFSGSYSFTKTLPGSAVGQSAVYQVRVTNTTNYIDTIDGWGKITTPLGSYKGLRQKRIENSSTVIEFQLSQFIPTWSTYQTINSNTTRYFYLTKETHGSVISFTYDSLNHPLTASWSLTPPAAPTPRFSFTYGANGAVAFHDSTDGYPDTYSWNYGDGSAHGTTASPTHTYTHDTTIVVCLTVANAGGSNTWCDTVHITGLSNGIAEIKSTDLHLYPNPASDRIHLDLSAMTTEQRNSISLIDVYDMMGQKLKSMPVGTTEISFSVADLSSGVYIMSLSLESGGNLFTKFEVLR